MSEKPTYQELEERIKELESRGGLMEEILHYARVGIYLFKLEDPGNDASLRLIFANPASEKITGIINEQILDQKIDDSFPHWREKGIIQVFADVVREKEGVEIEDIYYKNEEVITGAFLIKAYPVQHDCVCVTLENISRRIIENHKLEQKSELLELAMQVGNLAWWELNLKSGQVKGKQNKAELLGFAPGEGRSTFDWWMERIHPEDLEKTANSIDEHLSGKSDRYEVEYRIKAKDGTFRWFYDVGRVVKFNDSGQPLYLLGFSQDISDKKRAELKNLSQQKRFQDLVESTSDFIWELDPSANFTYVSPQVERILGYKPEELLGDSGYNPMPAGEAEKVEKVFNRCVREKTPFYGLVNINYHKDGHPVIMESNGVPFFDDQGELLGFRGIDRDITEKTKQDERLRKSLEEQEILLREIHHRVKNNLQLIVSLIKLQAIYNKEPVILEHLREISNRVKSMGFIHEKIYQTKDLSQIDFADYIRTITHSLMVNFNIKESKIKPGFDVEKIFLPIDTAIPCGLLINEIITNSLKHGFPDEKTGSITITLVTEKENEEYCLTISDNGVGLPEKVDFNTYHKLGLELIKGLTVQLKGTVDIDRTEGTKYTIHFKNVYKGK